MLQNPHKTLGFKKNMVYKIPPGGGGKPYPASGLTNGTTELNKRAVRAQDKKYLETTSPTEPLVQIQNNFIEVCLMMPSTKIAQIGPLPYSKGQPEL